MKNLSSETIKTERLTLRPISLSDAQDVFREFTPEITRYMYPKPAEKIEDTVEFIRSALAGLREGGNFQLVIADKSSGEFIGCCGLHHIGAKDPELGIWTKKSCHGNGYGREAIGGLIGWAEKNLEYEYLRYPVDRRNVASRRIPEAHGGTIARELKVMNMSGFELDEVEYRIRKPAPAAPLQIRPFESGDEDALFALMTHWDKDYAFDKAVFLASLEAILGSPDADILLAFQGRDLVGYAQTAICRHLGFAPFLEVVQLLVSAERRSSGTGRKLMERAEDLARSKGLNSVKLSSQVMRSRAHVFYERLGYMFYKISKFYEKVL